MARGDGLIIGGLAAAGITAGIAAYLLTHKPTVSCTSDAECPAGDVCVNGTCLPSATCSCASPDVCPTNGVCPSGYESDPANPGCCKPTSTSSSLIWSIGTSTGPLSPACVSDCVTAYAIEVTGLTPNGYFSFYGAIDPSLLGQVYDQNELDCGPTKAGYFCPISPSCVSNCPPQTILQADAFGNYSSIWYDISFCCNDCNVAGAIQCFVVPDASPTNFYLAVIDATTRNMSNVISIEPPSPPLDPGNCGCGSN